MAAALARPRPWSDRTASVDALRRLTAGEPVDAEPLLRAYLVERWLAALPSPDRRQSDGRRSPVRRTAGRRSSGSAEPAD